MLVRRFQPRRNAEDRTNEKGGIARWEKENAGLKKSRRMFSLAMLVCLIVGVSTGIRECIGAACTLAFVNATLGLEDLEKKMEDKK